MVTLIVILNFCNRGFYGPCREFHGLGGSLNQRLQVPGHSYSPLGPELRLWPAKCRCTHKSSRRRAPFLPVGALLPKLVAFGIRGFVRKTRGQMLVYRFK